MAARPHRLLVVDDNEDNRDMLARRLRRRGFEVDTAEDGFRALEMAGDGSYDLIVLDIMMPGMSGLEVLEKLRETFPRADLPVLMATAKSDSQDMVDALSLGANDYVTKPIDFPVVLARIMSHLQTRQQAPSVPAPAALLPADGRATPGTILDGRYEVLETIGEGGFAIVFKATQLSTGQPVAVKVLRALRTVGPDQKLEKDRFEREMKLIGELRHPNIVRLIDFGELKAQVRESLTSWNEQSDGGSGEVLEESSTSRIVIRKLPYIVMEFLEGETLTAFLEREDRLDVTTALELMLPVLSAVGRAHQAGVVHRDLKPPNIIVTRGVGERLHPHVLDFGIARPVDEERASAAPGTTDGLLGTPEYMAPEQASGAGEPDARSDQFTLGALLYECVTGRRPFHAETFIELLHSVATASYPRPRELRPDLDPSFEEVLLRAMAAEPSQRFSSVEAFGKALLPHASPEVRGHWSSGFDVASDPPPPRTEPTPVPLEPGEPATPPAAGVARYAWWVALGGAVIAAAAAAVWLTR